MAICPFMSTLSSSSSVGPDTNTFVYHDCLGSGCQLWDSINNRCGAKVSDTIRNRNINKHDALITLLEETSNRSTQATVLIGEYHGNQDLDRNGLVYGRDFKIADDGQKPPILKTLENSPTWEEPTTTISWSNYLGGL